VQIDYGVQRLIHGPQHCSLKCCTVNLRSHGSRLETIRGRVVGWDWNRATRKALRVRVTRWPRRA
jgi:hypothetical protein